MIRKRYLAAAGLLTLAVVAAGCGKKNDAGSASSLMNFVGTTLGSLGMVIVSINKDFQIKMIGICIFALSFISLILWYFIHNKIIIEKHE